jgi:hypothetical protein
MALAKVSSLLAGVALLLVATCGTSLAYETISAARTVSVPSMPPPGYLVSIAEPSFGESIIRITDPKAPAAHKPPCKEDYCRHRYSSAQSWNADQTLLVISRGCAGLCFLNGRTYQYLYSRRTRDACEWHPIDPARMICVGGRAISNWLVGSNQKSIIFDAEGYGALKFGPGKGNLSFDGRLLAVRARRNDGELVAFAYDIIAKRKYPDIALGRLKGENSYCSISPSGRHVFCFQRMGDKTNTAYVFTRDGNQIQFWPEHHRPGHGDMTIDSDGSDIYVGISKADPDKYHVIKRRLKDGLVTVLTSRGAAQHASARNIRRPGWVFLTYAGSRSKVNRPGRAPFYQEVVALRIDGSGRVKRIAHTRSAKAGYNSEAHASPSPDGSKVIWASNWGDPEAPISAYVATVDWDGAD